jgi:hypothetical protein
VPLLLPLASEFIFMDRNSLTSAKDLVRVLLQVCICSADYQDARAAVPWGNR